MVTIRDIAKQAGVTHTTVSAILSGRYEPTQPKAVNRAKEIRRIAQKLGYRPNSAARAVARGRFQRLGLVLPHGRSSYMPYDLMSGLTHALADRNDQLAVCELPPAGSGDDLPHMLRDLSVDGIINLFDAPDEKIRRLLEGQRLPMVWLNTKLPSNCVYPEEIDAARRLTAYMLHCGHRRIAYVDFDPGWTWTPRPSDHQEGRGGLPATEMWCGPRTRPRPELFHRRERREGYCQAMRDSGSRPRIHRVYGRSPDEHIADVTEILRGADRPTAVIVPVDEEVVRVVRAACAVGLTMPADIALGSFTWGGRTCPDLGVTSMVFSAHALAQAAVDSIHAQIESPAIAVAPKTLRGKLWIDRTHEQPGDVGPWSNRRRDNRSHTSPAHGGRVIHLKAGPRGPEL